MVLVIYFHQWICKKVRCYIDRPSLPLTPVQLQLLALTAEPAGSVTPPCPTSEQANHQHHLKLQQPLLPPGQASSVSSAAADPLQILPASSLLHRSGFSYKASNASEAAMARLVDCVAALLGWAGLRRYDVHCAVRACRSRARQGKALLRSLIKWGTGGGGEICVI